MRDRRLGYVLIAAGTTLGSVMTFFLPTDKLVAFLPFIGPVIGIGIAKLED
jgi:hypothetical protein